LSHVQNDMAAEQAEDEIVAPTFRYVNAYAVHRRYGGPEEGGWYFDVGRPLASIPCAEDDFDKVSTELIARLDALGVCDPHPHASVDRFSVIGNGEDLCVFFEDEFAAPYPKRTPHYE